MRRLFLSVDMPRFCILFVVLWCVCMTLYSRPALAQTASFRVVPLGVKGGSDESDLSAYLLSCPGSNVYLSLDAGTLYAGIRKATDNHVFAAGDSVLKKRVKGYFISHAHLDHVAGLVLNSPDDERKMIYGLPEVIANFRDSYFTWKSWANFGSEGDAPVLAKYQYVYLEDGKELGIANTPFAVTPLVLSHSEPYHSTAFLVRHERDRILYFGDTGSDRVEKTDRLKRVWTAIAPLIDSGQLKAIFIEVSFPDEQPESQLFGHLTPKLLMAELAQLSHLTGANKLADFPVVITHRKPSGDHESRIVRQLKKQNVLGVRLIYPRQGKLMTF